MSMRDDCLSYRFCQSLWAFIGSKWGDEVVDSAGLRVIMSAPSRPLGLTLAEPATGGYVSPQDWSLEFNSPHNSHQKLTASRSARDDWFLAPSISRERTDSLPVTARQLFFDLAGGREDRQKPIEADQRRA
jgi:hypothetical protein